ncbi:uncharacterized protein LOC142182007 [Nicotiana tabacum]|uniref:Uncharacterized protein LOC142182007 n=1 Tax=Nicotiana tabacum TaxID=4097 RepID=A0AC58UQW1_TOBAC
MCQFSPTWFRRKYSQWSEYSIKGDAAFCMWCYLFKNELESRGNAGDAFTKDGFRDWNKGVERFKAQVGSVNIIHHKCFNKMLDLKNQRQSIQSCFDKKSEKLKSDYWMRLNASINVARFLLRSGFSFRGHDESEESEYKSLFPSIVNVLKDMKRECPYHLDRFTAGNLLSKIQEFRVGFMLHLMFKVLLLTNELNKALQKKDQDIVNAMGMLDLAKKRLQIMRETE